MRARPQCNLPVTWWRHWVDHEERELVVEQHRRTLCNCSTDITNQLYYLANMRPSIGNRDFRADQSCFPYTTEKSHIHYFSSVPMGSCSTAFEFGRMSGYINFRVQVNFKSKSLYTCKIVDFHNRQTSCAVTLPLHPWSNPVIKQQRNNLGSSYTIINVIWTYFQ